MTRVLHLALVPLLVTTVAASDLFHVGPLELLAGGGLGDGGAALATGLLPTSALALADGSRLVADEQSNRIRRIDADGTIHTLVGNGQFGFNGDGLAPRDSHLGLAVDLAVDGRGRLFFVDVANSSVRTLADGLLQTFAGPDDPLFESVRGRFSPASLAVGPAGRVHVADRGTHVVWQLGASAGRRDGLARRAAGNGVRGYGGDGGPSALAQLADPRAVAVGGDGSIWIADTGNRRLRVVGPDGRISTAAGDGTESSPLATSGRHPAQVSLKPIDVSVGPQGHVFILDEMGLQLVRLGPSPRFSSGSLRGAGELSVVYRFTADERPVAVDVGPDGRAYVSDRGRRRLVVIDPARPGDAVAIGGNGTPWAAGDGTDARNAALYHPLGVAFDDDGAMIVADRLNALVRRVDANGIIESLPAADLRRPTGVAVAAGATYVADEANHRVVRIDADGASPLAGTGLAGADGDGGPARAAGLDSPAGLALDDRGRLLIADAGNGRIRRIETDGTMTTAAGNGAATPVDDGGPALTSALLRPVDVKADGGALWIADAGAHRVYRLGGDGLLRLVAGSDDGAGRAAEGSRARGGALDGPLGVEPDGLGGVYVADTGNGRILHVGPDGILRLVADGLGAPARLTTAPDGALVFTDVLQHRVGRVEVDRILAPATARVIVASEAWRLEARSALPMVGLQQLVTDPKRAILHVTHRGGLTVIDPNGAAGATIDVATSRFRTAAIEVSDLGTGFLIAAAPHLGYDRPLALISTQSGTGRRFDLEYRLASADALAVADDGTTFLHQAEVGGAGRLLRIPGERILNIPGFAGAVGGQGVGPDGALSFARLPAGGAALALASTDVYVALGRTGDVLRLHDVDGDGTANGPREQSRIGTLPSRATALAVSGGVVYAGTETGRVYRLHNGAAELVAEGFAPRLLDLAPAPAGGLYVLEGDGQAGRLLELTAAQPAVGVWPSHIEFEPAAIGSESVATIVLRNDGQLPVRVRPMSETKTLDAGADVELAPGDVRHIEVTWSPIAYGPAVEQLLWRDDAGAVVARTEVRIEGLAPRIDAVTDLDFGTVWVGGRQQATTVIGNAGQLPLAIRQLELVTEAGVVQGQTEVAVDGLTARIDEGIVHPGGSTPLHITLAPRRRGANDATLRLHSSDPEQPVHEVRLTGAGGGAELDLRSIDLGAVRVGSSRRHLVQLTNTGDLELRIDRLLAGSGSRQLTLTPSWFILAPGESADLRIDFAPATHGPVHGDLTLLTNDPGQPRWTIPFAGRGVSRALELSAEVHDFGAVDASQTPSWELTLTNHHDRTVKLESVTTTSRAFRVRRRPVGLAPGQSAPIVVEFRPADGPRTADLIVTTDLAEVAQLIVSLAGRTRSAARIVLDAPTMGVSLWPDEPLRVPVRVEEAQRLRGVLLSVAEPVGFELSGVSFPPGGIFGSAAPLSIEGDGPDGLRHVGLSITGDQLGAGVSGSGLLAELHFRVRPLATIAPQAEVRVATAITRAANGAQDTMPPAPPAIIPVQLRGDVTADGRVDLSDLFVIADALDGHAGPGAQYDLDDSGIFDIDDVLALVEHLPAAAASKAAATLKALQAPLALDLRAPYPNPFNSETVLVLHLPGPAEVDLSIYNLVGQRVARLVHGGLPLGRHTVAWDGTADDGRSMRSGIYFAHLQVGSQERVQRLLLVR